MLRKNFFTETFFIICVTSLAIIKADEELTNGDYHSPKQLSRVSRLASNLWPGAVVPYVLDSSVDATSKAEFEKAIADYHAKTCIRWKPRASEKAYVTLSIDKTVNCGLADNCYDGNPKNTRFNPGCAKKDTFIHELGHIVCFGHEQNRKDRDDYVEDCGNSGKYDHYNGGHLYDYLSIEHYLCDSCLKPKLPNVPRCGSPNGLSVLDAEKLNDFYECGGCLSYRFRFLSEITGNNAFVTGKEVNNDPMYACRVYHQGDIVPGKASLVRKDCHISYNGAEHRYTDKFEVLTNPKNVNLNWVKGGTIPKNAIPGGRTNVGEPLYIGRCTFTTEDGKTTTVTGKIHRDRPDVFYFSFNGGEFTCNPFDILVCS